MNKEEKSLLLKDLCARLPYYPICEMTDRLRVINNEPNPSYVKELFPKDIELFSYHNNFEIKPYLRPMSSMTEQEVEEYNDLCFCNTPYPGIAEDAVSNFMDWLNSHHFDYRGLIEKGLALEAPKDMYK